jgi:hypothetical protein
MKASKLFELVTMQWQRFGECEVIIDGGDYSLPIADILIIDSKLVIKTEPNSLNQIAIDKADAVKKYEDAIKQLEQAVRKNEQWRQEYDIDMKRLGGYLKAKRAECENLLTEVDASRITIATLADKVKEYEKG